MNKAQESSEHARGRRYSTFASSRCKPDPGRARTSAITIAGSYIVGGLVPLTLYFVLRRMEIRARHSVLVTVLAWLCFGYVKGISMGKRAFVSAWQTAVVGGLAAAAAFAIAKLIA